MRYASQSEAYITFGFFRSIDRSTAPVLLSRKKTLFRDDWENYTTFNPDPDRLIYHPEGYDPQELIRMQSWALKRFFLRPRQVYRQMVQLRTLSPKTLLYGLYGIAV